MSKAETIQKIVAYLQKQKVQEIGIFGSFVRNEMTANSDIDVLVEYSRGTTILDIVKMKQELFSLLGRKVDLVSKRAVRTQIMESIKNDLQTVYHA
ncbi:MAG: nucleotidyltransferase family protein [Bacteroidia bacterium]